MSIPTSHGYGGSPVLLGGQLIGLNSGPNFKDNKDYIVVNVIKPEVAKWINEIIGPQTLVEGEQEGPS